MQIRDSEYELESEWESGLHEGPQGEAFLGDLAKGVGSLLGLGESEWEGALGESEYELEGPLGEGPMHEGPMHEGPHGESYAYGEGPLHESFAYGEGPQHEAFAYGEGPMHEGPHGESYAYGEGPLHEQFLGGLGESEYEYEAGGLGEYESEYESEQFFGKILRRIPSIIKRVAPVLRNVANVALPALRGAIAGPLGSQIKSMAGPLGGQLAGMAGSLLGESELESEWESESESEYEATNEAPMHEAPLTQQQALGELMAAVASKAQTDAEAEAMIGAATVITLSPADRAALRRILPALVRGTAILTRILRRRRSTRPAIRSVPAIVRRTASTLQRRAAAGQPITKRSAARAMAIQTKKVLASPRTCSHDIQRNLRATRAVARTSRPPRQRPRGSAI